MEKNNEIEEEIREIDEKEADRVEAEPVQKKNNVEQTSNDENNEPNEQTKEDDFSKIEKMLKDEIEKLDDRLKRNMAEFDNFRKRTIKEKSSMYDDGVRTAIEKILPVVDNLERALISTDEADNSALRQGVEMTLRQFLEILNSIGVKEIEALDKEFDPNFHMAVAHVEDEAYNSNTVIEVLQKGYIYKEKVIRHSTVRVAN